VIARALRARLAKLAYEHCMTSRYDRALSLAIDAALVAIEDAAR
jgi:hypothetical protein